MTSFETTLASTISPMEGWCSTPKACALSHYIVSERLASCLEIGVFGGRSLVVMGLSQSHAGIENAITVGVDPMCRVETLEGDMSQADRDWWAKVPLHEIHQRSMEAIWATGLQNQIIFIRNSSAAAYKLLSQHEWDLIHIDGCHSEVSSTRDVGLWLPKLRPGGILVFDDVGWTTTSKAVKMVESQLTFLEEVDNCRFYRKPA